MRKKDLGDKLLEIVNEEYEKMLKNNNFNIIRKYADEFDQNMDHNPYFNVSVGVCAARRGDMFTSDRECAAFALGFERFKKRNFKIA